MGLVGKLALNLYELYVRAADKLFSLSIAGAFAEFGSRSIIQRPARISGASRISIGHRVFVGAGSWLNAITEQDTDGPAILIGSGTSMSGICVISAVRRVTLEENVLLARNVYISDHIHNYQATEKPVMSQGVGKVLPVTIGRGAWLGQNVVVCPGVTIGRGAVVGANSVVNADVPDYCLAVGSPARVVRKFSETDRPTP
jgi:acetyltransferase-like isoleucine patch superfamily enzyme